MPEPHQSVPVPLFCLSPLSFPRCVAGCPARAPLPTPLAFFPRPSIFPDDTTSGLTCRGRCRRRTLSYRRKCWPRKRLKWVAEFHLWTPLPTWAPGVNGRRDGIYRFTSAAGRGELPGSRPRQGNLSRKATAPGFPFGMGARWHGWFRRIAYDTSCLTVIVSVKNEVAAQAASRGTHARRELAGMGGRGRRHGQTSLPVAQGASPSRTLPARIARVNARGARTPPCRRRTSAPASRSSGSPSAHPGT